MMAPTLCPLSGHTPDGSPVCLQKRRNVANSHHREACVLLLKLKFNLVICFRDLYRETSVEFSFECFECLGSA